MTNKYCCDFMEGQLTYTCETHGDGDKCPNVVIARARFQGGEGELILIARNAEYTCNYCPSCGTKWPGAKIDFNVGDKVRVVRTDHHKYNCIGIVTFVVLEGVRVDIGGLGPRHRYFFYFNELGNANS